MSALEAAIQNLKDSGGSIWRIDVPTLINGLAEATARIEKLETQMKALYSVHTQPQ